MVSVGLHERAGSMECVGASMVFTLIIWKKVRKLWNGRGCTEECLLISVFSGWVTYGRKLEKLFWPKFAKCCSEDSQKIWNV